MTSLLIPCLALRRPQRSGSWTCLRVLAQVTFVSGDRQSANAGGT
ncbi:MAG TPA: hypothetical protein VEE85_02305 [Candidatus Bathyarchaeia archaeon]|nr:hypothetical protein [Candidatus Bathyarchaeia archaeon]